MQPKKANGGEDLGQGPRQTTLAAHQSIHSTSEPPAKLLTAADMRNALGGMGERRFHELRAAGIIGAPLELGPRAPRWTQQDLAETISRLPRRKRTAEPQTLADGRRARIESMKAAG